MHPSMCVALSLSLYPSLSFTDFTLLFLLHTTNPHTKFLQTLTRDSFQIYVKWTSNNVEFQYLSKKFVLEGIFQQMLLLETDITEVLWSLELLIIGRKKKKLRKKACPDFHFFSTGVTTAWEHSVTTIIMATDLYQHFKRTTKHNFTICQTALFAILYERILKSANHMS